ncbi:MAG: metalloregulator ArsR/SmtB family transcription factor [Candidatus Aegiribacteria sp.]|nr:metalloregulator ArsR/SmtB family transcription factor [Candidatus Aegiribacteria sp.]
MPTDKDRFEKRAEIIKAMANAARLMIVEELSRNEKTVSALTELVNLDISTVSRHLLILRHAGIVACERNGNQILYRLRTPCVLNFFDCVEKVMNGDEECTDSCSSHTCEECI